MNELSTYSILLMDTDGRIEPANVMLVSSPVTGAIKAFYLIEQRSDAESSELVLTYATMGGEFKVVTIVNPSVTIRMKR